MRTFLTDFLTQLKGIWSRLDGGQRLVVGSVLLATVAGLGALVWFAGRPSYEVVFTASTGEELATARRALGQNNVPFVPDGSGMALMVDRDKVGLAMAAIREAGLLAENSGSGIGMSSIIDDSETKAWKLANASIAKAEAAVREIAGVANARITASPPRKTRAFVDRDRETRPTATVLVAMRPGATFLDVAKTASNLTASQLGIPLENVTIADANNGQRWQHDPDRETGGGSSEFLAMQRTMSSERTARAQERLDQLWPNKTSIVVNVELDPKWEVVSEKVLPTNEIVRSEKTSKESNQSTSGAAASSGSITANSSQPPGSETKNETKDREFVTEIGERRTGRLAPEIKRITVAVLYDRSLEGPDFNPQDLANAVKAMVGWDKVRDSDEGFSVLPGDFQPVDVAELMSSDRTFVDLAMQWGPTVGQILGVIVVVLFLRGLFKRTSKGQAPSPAVAIVGEQTDKPMTPDEMQRRMRREIERAIASDPAALAKLLETWLIEAGN